MTNDAQIANIADIAAAWIRSRLTGDHIPDIVTMDTTGPGRFNEQDPHVLRMELSYDWDDGTSPDVTVEVRIYVDQ